MRNREIIHFRPDPNKIPYREASRYEYKTACGRKVDTGDDSKLFLQFTHNKRKVTCKQCKKTKIYLGIKKTT